MNITDDYSRSPLVSAIVSTLTERIRSGRYEDGAGFPSERALVEEFGVSRTAIRKVLETLDAQNLVVRSPRCRTIVRSPGGLAPPPTESGRRSLGLWIWPSPRMAATAAVVQGICQALNHDAYRLVIGNVVWDNWESVLRSEEKFLDRMTEDRDISGILLWYLGGRENLSALQRVRAANIPMVFMDRLPPASFEADYVGVDNELAAEMVIRHLLDQGHRRIAHITNLDNASTVAERLAGYRRALEEAGIPFRPELVVPATEASPEEAAKAHAALAERLLSLPDPPTAVFAVNDELANRFMDALRMRGMRVPEEMAVAGFDGLERWTAREPFLTTIYQPFEQLGAHAVRVLLRRIETSPSATYRHVLLEAPLSIQGSTRIPRREAIP